VKNRLPLGFLMMVVVATAFARHIDTRTSLVSVFGNDRATEQRTLSSEKLQALSRWLEQGRSGWQGEMTEASRNEEVELRIDLKHSNGSATSIFIVDRVGGGHFLRLTGPGTWAYQSFAGLYKTWAAFRLISDTDLRALQNLIGVER
jgi:hypothetical protein